MRGRFRLISTGKQGVQSAGLSNTKAFILGASLFETTGRITSMILPNKLLIVHHHLAPQFKMQQQCKWKENNVQQQGE